MRQYLVSDYSSLQRFMFLNWEIFSYKENNILFIGLLEKTILAKGIVVKYAHTSLARWCDTWVDSGFFLTYYEIISVTKNSLWLPINKWKA